MRRVSLRESSSSDVVAHLSSPSTVNVAMYSPGVLDDTRRPGTKLKSRIEALNGKVPGLERRASCFRENIDGVEQDNNAMHDVDPALPLVGSNAEDIMPEPEALAATQSHALGW